MRPDIQQVSSDALQIPYPPRISGTGTLGTMRSSIPSSLELQDPATFDCFHLFSDNRHNPQDAGDGGRHGD
jgi:hypothetical protein